MTTLIYIQYVVYSTYNNFTHPIFVNYFCDTWLEPTVRADVGYIQQVLQEAFIRLLVLNYYNLPEPNPALLSSKDAHFCQPSIE